MDAAFYTPLRQHPELLDTLHWRRFEQLLADMRRDQQVSHLKYIEKVLEERKV